MQKNTTSSDFPFESRYATINGQKMHYIDEGSGDPILFIHGNPTSSYLWRNIIPSLTMKARCIAVDLIGMGLSDKPNIDYRFFDHANYLEGFIKSLNLENITLVMHDWGAGLGIHYAKRNEDKIKGVCFMEAITRPLEWKDLGFIDRWVLKRFRHPVKGDKSLVKKNEFIEKVMPRFVVRKLKQDEMDNYRAPFKEEAHRKVISQWPKEIPISGEPEDVYTAIKQNYDWLLLSRKPKLLLWSKPGAIIKEPYVKYLSNVLQNATIKNVGKGRHYIQEDSPDNIASEISHWYERTI